MNRVDSSNNLADLIISYHFSKCMPVKYKATMNRFEDLLDLSDLGNELRKRNVIVIYASKDWRGAIDVFDSIEVEYAGGNINRAYFMSGKEDTVIHGGKMLSSGKVIIELVIGGGSYIIFEIIFLDFKALSILMKTESLRARDIIKYNKEFFRIRLRKRGYQVISFRIVK